MATMDQTDIRGFSQDYCAPGASSVYPRGSSRIVSSRILQSG